MWLGCAAEKLVVAQNLWDACNQSFEMGPHWACFKSSLQDVAPTCVLGNRRCVGFSLVISTLSFHSSLLPLSPDLTEAKKSGETTCVDERQSCFSQAFFFFSFLLLLLHLLLLCTRLGGGWSMFFVKVQVGDSKFALFQLLVTRTGFGYRTRLGVIAHR